MVTHFLEDIYVLNQPDCLLNYLWWLSLGDEYMKPTLFYKYKILFLGNGRKKSSLLVYG